MASKLLEVFLPFPRGDGLLFGAAASGPPEGREGREAELRQASKMEDAAGPSRPGGRRFRSFTLPPPPSPLQAAAG